MSVALDDQELSDTLRVDCSMNHDVIFSVTELRRLVISHRATGRIEKAFNV
jgi:hypothetical protein